MLSGFGLEYFDSDCAEVFEWIISLFHTDRSGHHMEDYITSISSELAEARLCRSWLRDGEFQNIGVERRYICFFNLPPVVPWEYTKIIILSIKVLQTIVSRVVSFKIQSWGTDIFHFCALPLQLENFNT